MFAPAGTRQYAMRLARFDGVELPPERLRVTEDEISAAERDVSDELLDAIRVGLANIRAFNERLLEGCSWTDELAPGLLVGERAGPIASAGLFVPAGKGSFPSVLMHLGGPAVAAGVPEIVVLTPPLAERAGEVDPAVLAVAGELGLRQVFRVNGPAGIAACAFGTETIPAVVKVVGPGSPAVTAAQILVQAYGCSTAMLFGPSESLVIADDTADLSLLAADLINEAEHGDDSAALLVTWSEQLVKEVDAKVERQLVDLPEWRRRFAEAALSRYGGAVLVRRPGRGVRLRERVRARAPAARRPRSGRSPHTGRACRRDPARPDSVCRGELPPGRPEHPSDRRLRPPLLGRDRADVHEGELGRPRVPRGAGASRAGRDSARSARGLSRARSRDPGSRVVALPSEVPGSRGAFALSRPELGAARVGLLPVSIGAGRG